MATLVKFAVVRNETFGNCRHKSAAVKDEGAVIKPAADLRGRAYKHENALRQIFSKVRHSLVRGRYERALIEQISASVARKAQLGKNYKLRAIFGGRLCRSRCA